MHNILKKFSRFINDIYSKIKSFLINFPSFCQEQYNKLIINTKDMVVKFNNLRNTNLDLAKYHLLEGRIFDAKLRLGILNRFITKNDKEVINLLGWTYYIDGDIDKAFKYFTLANEVKMVNFLSNTDACEQIPLEIYRSRKSWQANYYDSLFLEGRNYLPHKVYELLVEFMPVRQSRKILDLGAATGIMASEFLNNKTGDELFAVENSEAMINHINKFYKNLYEKIYYEDTIDFLLHNQEKFDIILSFCSLDFVKDLSLPLKNIYECLNEGGVFCLTLSTNLEKTKLSLNLANFVYHLNDVIKILEKIGYFILTQNTSKIRNIEYTTIIAKNNYYN
ncbi:MAG: class I SAM-dependent methyltransferase [Rickettsiaceae bacterium]|nr:class I SAM-dependent methyltransferase [Rickettsiaceae bacterium]